MKGHVGALHRSACVGAFRKKVLVCSDLPVLEGLCAWFLVFTLYHPLTLLFPLPKSPRAGDFSALGGFGREGWGKVSAAGQDQKWHFSKRPHFGLFEDSRFFQSDLADRPFSKGAHFGPQLESRNSRSDLAPWISKYVEVRGKINLILPCGFRNCLLYTSDAADE